MTMNEYHHSQSATLAEVTPLRDRTTIDASVPVVTSAAALGRAAQLVAAAQDFVMLGAAPKASTALRVAEAYRKLAADFREQEAAYLAELDDTVEGAA